MCVAGLGADVSSLFIYGQKVKRIREQLRQTRLPASSLRDAAAGVAGLCQDPRVHPLAASRSHDSLASKQWASIPRASADTDARRPGMGSSSQANRIEEENATEPSFAGSSTSGLVPSRSLVDVAAAVAGRPVTGSLNWSARLERRALKAQLSVVQHKHFAKRLSLHKNIFDLICATNTAYGSGLIYKQYTDLVIGLAGFYSSVLGAYRAWLAIFPWTPKSQKVHSGHGYRASMLLSPRVPVAETPPRPIHGIRLASVVECPRKLSRAASGTHTHTPCITGD